MFLVCYTSLPLPLFYFIPDIFDYSLIVFPTDSTGATLYPPILRPKGTCFLSGLGDCIIFYYYISIIFGTADLSFVFSILFVSWFI